MMLYGGLSEWRPMSDRGKTCWRCRSVCRERLLFLGFGYGVVLEDVLWGRCWMRVVFRS